MMCPYGDHDFIFGTACDNDCGTYYCCRCDGEIYLEGKKYVKGHDPKCGESSMSDFI